MSDFRKVGEASLDQGSVNDWQSDPSSKEFLDKYADQMKNTLKVSDLKVSDFVAVFYPGGNAPMFDLPFDNSSLEFASQMYEKGGVVSAVCHGPCALANVKVNGDWLIKGKTVCGFTNEEEEFTGIKEYLPFLLETQLRANGGIFEGVAPWQANCKVSERLVTGQNPASAGLVGEAIVNLLKK